MWEIAKIEHFPQIWGHMEAKFLWIFSSGLSEAHNLRVLSLRHKDSCIKNMHSLFGEVRIVRQVYSFFGFFWLARFVFLDALGFFLVCAISEWGCLTSTLVSFLWYVDSLQQFWESYVGYVFAVVPEKWAIWRS